MIKVDLITGFLGSGKTTFIRKYVGYLLRQGFSVGILENDFGAVNVDMMLLSDLIGDHCEVEMIAGGCDRDCHRRRFKTKLIAMGMCGYDRVIVEPSGIYDVDKFFDVLREEPLDQWYEIDNVIAIVDAGLEENLSEEADYLLASECANAGKILLSRIGKVSGERKQQTISHLNRALEQVRCKRRLREEILDKDWQTLTDEDFEDIMRSGFVAEDYEKLYFEEKEAFSSVYFLDVHLKERQLRRFAERVFSDRKYGKVLRVKGFMKTDENSWIQLNAVPGEARIQPGNFGQEVLIVIGEGLCEEELRKALGSCE